jgi:hypothetical protein
MPRRVRLSNGVGLSFWCAGMISLAEANSLSAGTLIVDGRLPGLQSRSVCRLLLRLR